MFSLSPLLSYTHTRSPVSTKMMQCELRVKFYWGQNEDCSPGDSTSDSSERLLQRDSGGRSIYMILAKGEFYAIKHSFYKWFSAGHDELMSSWS